MITKEDVLEAIGKDRVRQSTIETELVFAGKAKKHPTEIGVSESDRQLIRKHLRELEEQGLIQSYGIEKKSYELSQ